MVCMYVQVSERIGQQPAVASLYQYVFNTGRYPAQPCDTLCMRMSHCETASSTFMLYSKCLVALAEQDVQEQAVRLAM